MNEDVILLARALDFAARKHMDQRRKGLAEEPYVNHLAEVARLLAEATCGTDVNLVCAGLLHDTIEDQGVRRDDLAIAFNEDIAALVEEVTDDKSLEKQERKRLAIEKVGAMSARARLLKLADLTSNLRSLAASPPREWPPERRRAYFDWAREVAAGCRGLNSSLDGAFDEAWQRGVY